MKFTLVPEYRFQSFENVTPEFLLSIGVKGVLLDVDNTLEPYEHPTPGDNVLSWLSSLHAVGIKTVIISNNNQARVDLFNQDIGILAFSRAGKPFPFKLNKAMELIGTNKENTIFMGDQILTDVWAAHNAGIRAILVPPINDRRDLLTRVKRILEKPIQKKYDKIHRGENK
ncbi:MAG: YqeG family HAD IIIA-type phosphatase [Clostridia bacterium]|nr:YqeG family HAD IIIA-type phosphatase [Clostridia bacterium]